MRKKDSPNMRCVILTNGFVATCFRTKRRLLLTIKSFCFVSQECGVYIQVVAFQPMHSVQPESVRGDCIYVEIVLKVKILHQSDCISRHEFLVSGLRFGFFSGSQSGLNLKQFDIWEVNFKL